MKGKRRQRHPTRRPANSAAPQNRYKSIGRTTPNAAPQRDAQIDSCPEGNHSILQQRRTPTRRSHMQPAEASIFSRKIRHQHYTRIADNVNALSSQERETRENTQQPRKAWIGQGAERQEGKAALAASFATNTALLTFDLPLAHTSAQNARAHFPSKPTNPDHATPFTAAANQKGHPPPFFIITIKNRFWTQKISYTSIISFQEGPVLEKQKSGI